MAYFSCGTVSSDTLANEESTVSYDVNHVMDSITATGKKSPEFFSWLVGVDGNFSSKTYGKLNSESTIGSPSEGVFYNSNTSNGLTDHLIDKRLAVFCDLDITYKKRPVVWVLDNGGKRFI